MKALILILLLIGSPWVLADQDPELLRLQAAINLLQQEQQSVYQQFLMAQELRRNEQQNASSPAAGTYFAMGPDSSQVVDYDENLRAQRERQGRTQRYDQDVSQAYARYLELGEQKKALLDQLLQLSRSQRR